MTRIAPLRFADVDPLDVGAVSAVGALVVPDAVATGGVAARPRERSAETAT